MEVPVSYLPGPAQKVFRELDAYLTAMRLNTGRAPSQLVINRKQQRRINAGLEALNGRQNKGSTIKTQPMRVEKCTFRGFSIAVQ